MTNTTKPFRCIVNADLFNRAWLFVSSEETRFYLQGVNIEPHPDGGALLVATDGRTLICLRDPNGYAEGSAIVRPNSALLAALKKPPKIGGLRTDPSAVDLIVADNKAIAAIWRGEGEGTERAWSMLKEPGACVLSYQWTTVLIDGTFPHWRSVVPKNKPVINGTIAVFNYLLMSRFAKALGRFNSEPTYLRIMRPSGSGDSWIQPHFVTANNHGEIEGFGIIMPMRPAGKDLMPDWWHKVSSRPEVRS